MPADPTQVLIDTPEPAERTALEIMFPQGGTPFTPKSRCPHWCKLCDGAGSLVEFETRKVHDCPDCGGTGQSWPDAPFVCAVCHRSGKDGHRALPHEVDPPAVVDAA